MRRFRGNLGGRRLWTGGYSFAGQSFLRIRRRVKPADLKFGKPVVLVDSYTADG